MSSAADVDVLIAGAGPVGLTLAGELARHSVCSASSPESVLSTLLQDGHVCRVIS